MMGSRFILNILTEEDDSVVLNGQILSKCDEIL